ncbi:MAG: MATE family efflux transporter [Kiritimatiellia bacterium]
MSNDRQNHLTDGSLVRGILRLAIPMLVSAVLQNAQSLIDLYWIGRLGADSVAALAIGGTILMMLFPLVMGMAVGTVAIVSRRIGEGDARGTAYAAGQALSVAMGLGLIAGAAGWLFADELPRLLGAEPAVALLASEYLKILFLGSFTVFVLFVGGHSIFQAAGNTVIPMILMIAANILNLVLDPILIFGLYGIPALGVRGAAIATVMSQALAAGGALVLLHYGIGGIKIRLRHMLPQPAIALNILRIGLPGTGQMLARSLMALVLMRIAATAGTAAIAAFGAGNRLQMLILMPAFALGNAAATLVGQNLGAGRPDRAERGAWIATWMDIALMVLLGGALALFAPELMRVFTPDANVITIGTDFLRITCGFYVFVAPSIVLGRALQGAGDTLTPMILTLVSLWGIQVPLAIILSRVFEPATHGIWWAIAIAVTIHGILVAICFQCGKWKQQRV